MPTTNPRQVDAERIAKPAREMTWQDRGLCNETDPELFYPEIGSTGIEAKKVCVRCPVQKKCIDWAMETEEPWGVWGGYTAHERQLMKKGVRIVSLDKVRAKVQKENAKRAKAAKRR